MATLVLTDAVFVWNSVDLSDHVQSVTLDYSAELQDDTAMGDDTRSRKGGLKDWSMTVDLYQDEAANEVAQTLFSDVGVARTVYVQSDSTTVAATNPRYSGTGVLESFPPVTGSVGDMHVGSISIQAAGTLSRATSS